MLPDNHHVARESTANIHPALQRLGEVKRIVVHRAEGARTPAASSTRCMCMPSGPSWAPQARAGDRRVSKACEPRARRAVVKKVLAQMWILRGGRVGIALLLPLSLELGRAARTELYFVQLSL